MDNIPYVWGKKRKGTTTFRPHKKTPKEERDIVISVIRRRRHG